MRHNPLLKRTTAKHQQSGSMIATGLFIIVFMAILLAGIMRTISVGGNNTAYEVIGLRALLSAKSGLEIGLARLYPLNSEQATSCAEVTASPVSLPDANAFNRCAVSLSCETRENVNNGKDLFIITATGQCTHSTLTTSRQLVIEAIGS